jgi:hypothetical protein
VTNLKKYYPGNCLEGPRKTTNTRSQESLCPDRSQNWDLPNTTQKPYRLSKLAEQRGHQCVHTSERSSFLPVTVSLNTNLLPSLPGYEAQTPTVQQSGVTIPAGREILGLFVQQLRHMPCNTRPRPLDCNTARSLSSLAIDAVSITQI